MSVNLSGVSEVQNAGPDGEVHVQDNVIIAVMGPTGSGKSSFIRTATGRPDIVVGHGLTSTTEQVKAYSFKSQGVEFTLIDTPGFDDTYRDDAAILKEISTYLEQSFRAGARLRAVLYLHNITKTRLEGSTLDNLYLFRSLCGPDCLKNVLLGLTFWECIGKELCAERESQLRNTPDFWGKMIERGSRVARIPTNKQSAVELLLRLANKDKMTLMIQEELARGIKLEDTAAGSTVRSLQELIALRQQSDAEIAAFKEKTKQELEERNRLRREKQEEDEAAFKARLEVEKAESEASRILQEERVKQDAERRKREIDELRKENERIDKEQRLVTEQLKQMQLDFETKEKEQSRVRKIEVDRARYLSNRGHLRQQLEILDASSATINILMAKERCNLPSCDRCGSPISAKLGYCE